MCAIAKNLIELIVRPLNPDIPRPLRRLVQHPPPIEKLDNEEADIHMLRLIDAPDHSAEGVGLLLEEVRKQTGRSPDLTVADLQVVEGDVGTCINIESLRQHRLATSMRACKTFSQYLEQHTHCGTMHMLSCCIIGAIILMATIMVFGALGCPLAESQSLPLEKKTMKRL